MLTHSRRNLITQRWLIALIMLIGLLGHSCVATKNEQGPTSLLQANAEEALQAEQFDRAEMLLERAMRVEPRNPENWHLMGRVRFGQHRYAQAVQFCLKSNSLVGKNATLGKQNWILIEKAYTAMGETQKAAEIRRNYLERP
ncbi:MAG: hypothetical protein OEY01_07915 [Desulfobulbaceae bacterium]|nr:hypothetical protein [Desulfobulbaceae bacterium]HIJ78982.1 hypothetical protein [Deltaproteobacteria bacterium]